MYRTYFVEKYHVHVTKYGERNMKMKNMSLKLGRTKGGTSIHVTLPSRIIVVYSGFPNHDSSSFPKTVLAIIKAIELEQQHQEDSIIPSCCE